MSSLEVQEKCSPNKLCRNTIKKTNGRKQVSQGIVSRRLSSLKSTASISAYISHIHYLINTYLVTLECQLSEPNCVLSLLVDLIRLLGPGIKIIISWPEIMQTTSLTPGQYGSSTSQDNVGHLHHRTIRVLSITGQYGSCTSQDNMGHGHHRTLWVMNILGQHWSWTSQNNMGHEHNRIIRVMNITGQHGSWTSQNNMGQEHQRQPLVKNINKQYGSWKSQYNMGHEHHSTTWVMNNTGYYRP